MNGDRDSVRPAGRTRGAGLIGLVLLLGAGPTRAEEGEATTCPTGYRAVGRACVHGSAIVDANATLGAGAVIKEGATIAKGARIGRKTVVESLAVVGEHTRLGARNVVRERSTIPPNVRTRARTSIQANRDGVAVYSRLPLSERPPSRARTLRPSARTRLGQTEWPITHEQIWTAFCDTPTTGAFNPAGDGLRLLTGRRAESGVGHRRVYTVCVEIDEDDRVRISASPANRWPRALTFQSLEILTRQRGRTPMTIEVDGTVAMETAATLRLGTLAESVPDARYFRQYTPTYREGAVTVRVSPPADSGAAVAARILAFADEVRANHPNEAGQLQVLGRALSERRDIPRDWTRDLETALAGTDPARVIKAIEVLKPVTTTSQTIQVEGVYNLSVFTGVGIVTGDARSSAYEIVEIDDARSLVSDGSAAIDPELVLGATLFPGRKPKTWTGFDLGISTALGVVSLDEGGLDAFRSVYFGPTLGWRALALTPALAIKKGTHLREGNTVGMSIASSATTVDDLTESRWGLGLALMLTIPFAELNSFPKARSAATGSTDGGSTD